MLIPLHKLFPLYLIELLDWLVIDILNPQRSKMLKRTALSAQQFSKP